MDLGITNEYGHMDFLTQMQDNNDPASSFMSNKITAKEVSTAINSTKCNKSPGMDEIAYEVLKQFSPNLITWLTEFYNLVLENRKFPSAWKLLCSLNRTALHIDR